LSKLIWGNRAHGEIAIYADRPSLSGITCRPGLPVAPTGAFTAIRFGFSTTWPAQAAISADTGWPALAARSPRDQDSKFLWKSGE
jgi:hypothetical protein